MQDAFGIVIFGVVIVGSLIAIGTFIFSSGVYDQIGKGGLFTEDPHAPKVSEPVSAAVRDTEIRQMLEARNARRIRRGEAPVDIEAELAELSKPALDAGLLSEIRDLVEARNARRIRQGREPLDVDAEVARQIADLQG